MPPSLVLCLRHGEKPTNAEKSSTPLNQDGPGLDQHGRVSPHSLTTKGWQRAYALAASQLCGQLAEAALSNGVVVFVPDYRGNSERRRPYQTILPFSLRQGVEPQHPCTNDDADKLHDAVTEVDGVAVVCWQHGSLADLVSKLVGRKVEWPGDRFDAIWVLSPGATGDKYSLKRRDQKLVRGDRGFR